MAYSEKEFLEMKKTAKKKKAEKAKAEKTKKRDELIDEVIDAELAVNSEFEWFTSAWMTEKVAALGNSQYGLELDDTNSNGMNTILNRRYRAGVDAGQYEIIDKSKAVVPQVFKIGKRKVIKAKKSS